MPRRAAFAVSQFRHLHVGTTIDQSNPSSFRERCTAGRAFAIVDITAGRGLADFCGMQAACSIEEVAGLLAQ
jgi:hypothetical protein